MSCGPKMRPIWDEYKKIGKGPKGTADCRHCLKPPFNRNISTLYKHLVTAHPTIAQKYKPDGTLKRFDLKRRKEDATLDGFMMRNISLQQQQAAEMLLALWSSVHGIKHNPFDCPIFREYHKILCPSFDVPGRKRIAELSIENKKRVQKAVHHVAKLSKQGPGTIDKSSDGCGDGIAHFVIFADGKPLLLQQFR